MANPDDLAALITRVARLEAEGRLLAEKLQYALQYVPVAEGVFTFPDGDSWPAGDCAQPTPNAKLMIRVAVLTEALEKCERAECASDLGTPDCCYRTRALSSAGDPELLAAVQGLVRATRHAEDILGFHEGSDEVEREGAEPTVRINYEDFMGVLNYLREALAHPALRAWSARG